MSNLLLPLSAVLLLLVVVQQHAGNSVVIIEPVYSVQLKAPAAAAEHEFAIAHFYR